MSFLSSVLIKVWERTSLPGTEKWQAWSHDSRSRNSILLKNLDLWGIYRQTEKTREVGEMEKYIL